MTSPLISGLPASCHRIEDFDLVTLDGRPTLVASPGRDRLLCTWDPVADRWTRHELDVPDEDRPHTDLTAIGAAVVGGRIVVGGGGDHQGFAMWDLGTGRVRLSAQDGGAGPVTRVDFGDGPRLLVGSSGTWGVELWNPAHVEEEDAPANPQRPSPYDSAVYIEELECRSSAGSAVAAGLLGDRPVVVAGGRDGGVLVWDVERERRLAAFEDPDESLTDFALVSQEDQSWIAAAGGDVLMVGDPVSGEWGEPLSVPGDGITCLTAATLHDRAFAVTGAEDGVLCVWDLTERRLRGTPFRGDGGEVLALGVAEVGGRPVIVSSGHGGAVHLWAFPPD